MFLAVFAYRVKCTFSLLGGAAYVRKPPGGSVLGSICAILREACRKRKRRHSSNGRSVLIVQ